MASIDDKSKNPNDQFEHIGAVRLRPDLLATPVNVEHPIPMLGKYMFGQAKKAYNYIYEKYRKS